MPDEANGQLSNQALNQIDAPASISSSSSSESEPSRGSIRKSNVREPNIRQSKVQQVLKLAPSPAPVKEATKTITYVVVFILVLLIIGIPYEISRYLARNRVVFTATINDTLFLTVNDTSPALDEDLFECGSRYRFQGRNFTALRFCKLYQRQFPFGGFKKHKLFVGKSFVNSSDCYALATTEFFEDLVELRKMFLQKVKVQAPKIEYLTTGSIFLKPRELNMSRPACSPVPFDTVEEIILHHGDAPVNLGTRFLLSRAITYSNICKGYQRIPALYSPEKHLCFFGAAVGAPTIPTDICEIYCHSDEAKRDPADPLYATNT